MFNVAITSVIDPHGFLYASEPSHISLKASSRLQV